MLYGQEDQALADVYVVQQLATHQMKTFLLQKSIRSRVFFFSFFLFFDISSIGQFGKHKI